MSFVKKYSCYVLCTCALASPAAAQSSDVTQTYVNNDAKTLVFEVSGTKGALQIGSEQTLCDETTAGALRFNKTTASFEGCNGEEWKNFAGEKAVQVSGVYNSDYHTTLHNLTFNGSKTDMGKHDACFLTEVEFLYPNAEYYSCTVQQNADGTWTLFSSTDKRVSCNARCMDW